jgi:ABC-type phosphate transport system substrate-binding protein
MLSFSGVVLMLTVSFAMFGAGGAYAEVAAPPPHCPNALTISGLSPRLQTTPQNVWTLGYNAACATGPATENTPGGEYDGLIAWRFNGAAAGIDHTRQFVGTDEAPNRGQIGHAEEVSGGAKPIIVPVTQTAIAVVAHPPTGCKFQAGTGITWKDLNKIFGGNGITLWSGITNIEETTANACKVAIKRVVRAEAAAVTTQFKNYLQVLHAEKAAESLPCNVALPGGGAAVEWAQLRGGGGPEQPNTIWPECMGSTEVRPVVGGAKLVEEVSAISGTIGYAALPDAEAHIAASGIIALQNAEVAGSPVYRSPANTVIKTARCEEAVYTVPAEAQSGGTGTGIGADWSTVYDATPGIGGTEYPLCMLTYDIGWTNYTSAGFGANATGWGKDVADYIRN